MYHTTSHLLRQFVKKYHRQFVVASLGFSINVMVSLIIAPLAIAQDFKSPIATTRFFSPVVTTTEESTPITTNDCGLSASFTPEIQEWADRICRWSIEHKMDPNLIATIMQIESCGNNNAVSATGVRGLFQVTGANLDGENPFNPDVSMAKGPGKVLKNELKASDGNITAAMAGYNGGAWARQWVAGDLDRSQFISKLRSHYLWRTTTKALAKVNEVERYAQWANIYYEAKEGRQDTLNEWLNLGGYRLCNSAAVELGLNPRYTKTPDGPVVASDIETR